jgi:hypothetical protein
MPEVFTVGDTTYYTHARLTPIGGLWEGTVEIVTSTLRTIHVCGGVHDDADGAYREALSSTTKLLQYRGRTAGGSGIHRS